MNSSDKVTPGTPVEIKLISISVLSVFVFEFTTNHALFNQPGTQDVYVLMSIFILIATAFMYNQHQMKGIVAMGVPILIIAMLLHNHSPNYDWYPRLLASITVFLGVIAYAYNVQL